MLYVGGYLAGTGVGEVSGSVPGALLLGMRPEVLEEMNHQLHLWDCRLNEFNAVCKQNKVAPYIGFSNEPTIICVFQGTAHIFQVAVECFIWFYTACSTCSLGLCLCI